MVHTSGYIHLGTIQARAGISEALHQAVSHVDDEAAKKRAVVKRAARREGERAAAAKRGKIVAAKARIRAGLAVERREEQENRDRSKRIVALTREKHKEVQTRAEKFPTFPKTINTLQTR
jgi:hypothetical protein